MSVVDASVWIAAWLREDGNHLAAAGWLEAHVLGGGHTDIPTIALAETAGATSRRMRDTDAGLEAVRNLRQTPRLRITALDQSRASTAARIAAERFLRGADAIYVALAQSLVQPLVTLDREIESRVSDLVQVVIPRA